VVNLHSSRRTSSHQASDVSIKRSRNLRCLPRSLPDRPMMQDNLRATHHGPHGIIRADWFYGSWPNQDKLRTLACHSRCRWLFHPADDKPEAGRGPHCGLSTKHDVTWHALSSASATFLGRFSFLRLSASAGSELVLRTDALGGCSRRTLWVNVHLICRCRRTPIKPAGPRASGRSQVIQLGSHMSVKWRQTGICNTEQPFSFRQGAGAGHKSRRQPKRQRLELGSAQKGEIISLH
jgi:hypothetical protein